MPSSLPLLARALLLATLLALPGCNDDGASTGTTAAPATTTCSARPVATDTSPDYWPTAGWQTATPESQGFCSHALDHLAQDAASQLPYYTSLLVIRNGWIVHESYHDTVSETSDADTRHHVWSITKSVTSITVGRAWTLGDLTDLDVTAGSTLPSSAIAPLAADDPKRDITLRQVLQMRSGLAWNEPAWLLNGTALRDPLLRAFNGLDPACTAGDLLCSILQMPLAYTPGTVWNYDTYDSYLASAFFTQITGTSLNQYAADNLFTPIGVTFDVTNDWPNLPDPITFGGGLLGIRSRDLGRLGMVMLYDGQWDGAQLLGTDWIDLSTTPQGMGHVALFDGSGEPRAITASDAEMDIPYALQWWRVTGPGLGGTPSLSGRGLAGQMLHIFKDKELIILLTCDSDMPKGREAEINDFLKARILDKAL